MSNLTISGKQGPEIRFALRNVLQIEFRLLVEIFQEITGDETIRWTRRAKDEIVLASDDRDDYEMEEITGILEHYLGRRIQNAFWTEDLTMYFILTEVPKEERMIPASAMQQRINNLTKHLEYKTKIFNKSCESAMQKISAGGPAALVEQTPRDVKDLVSQNEYRTKIVDQIDMLEHILKNDAVSIVGIQPVEV